MSLPLYQNLFFLIVLFYYFRYGLQKKEIDGMMAGNFRLRELQNDINEVYAEEQEMDRLLREESEIFKRIV